MSSMPQPDGTTATVYDFMCLFTHDLKRKQKRWQDGKLKYHTFNRKLMVYDDRGNFVGESHWQEEGLLEDGCELALERGSAIVQVAECVGSRDQDLTELVEKRAKEVEARRASKVSRSVPGSVSTPSASRIAPGTHAHHLHRPLTSLVASPGPIGRAVIPTVSPFESRIAERTTYMTKEVNSGTSKRKRSVSPPSKMGHARALFGTQLSLSATPMTLSQARRGVLSQRPTNVPPVVSTVEDDGEKQRSEDMVEVASEPARPRAVGQKRPQPSSRPAMQRQIVLEDSPEPEPQVVEAPARSNPTKKPAKSRPEPVSREPDSPTTVSPNTISPETNSESRSARKRQRSPSLGGEAASKRPRRKEKSLDKPPPNDRPKADVPCPETDAASRMIDLTDDAAPTTDASIPRTTLKSREGDRRKLLTAPKPTESGTKACKPKKPADETKSREKATVSAPIEPAIMPQEKPERRSDEPRTELRIRPRQKRGLLMMSERKAKALPITSKTTTRLGEEEAETSAASTPDDDPPRSRQRSARLEDPYDLAVTDDEGPVLTKEKQAVSEAQQSIAPVEDSDKRFEDWLGADDAMEEPGAVSEVTGRESSPPPKKTKKSTTRSKPKAKEIIPENEDEEDSTGPPPKEKVKASTKSNTKAKEPMDEDEPGQDGTASEEKQAQEQAKKGPRIARLSRKGVKSREILGFVSEQGAGFQTPFGNHGNHSLAFTSGQTLISNENEAATKMEGPAVGLESDESLGAEHQSPEKQVTEQGHDVTVAPETTRQTRPAPPHAAKATTQEVVPEVQVEGALRNPPIDAPRTAPLTPEVVQPIAEEARKAASPNAKNGPQAALDAVIKSGSSLPTPSEPTDRPVQAPGQEDSPTQDPMAAQDLGKEIEESREAAPITATVKCAPAPTGTSSLDGLAKDTGPPRRLSLAEKHAPDHDIAASRLDPAPTDAGPPPVSVSQSLVPEKEPPATSKPEVPVPEASAGRSLSRETSATSIDNSVSGSAPRPISNPATRGRKAAAKKDAAGMAPRTLVQLDPPRPAVMRKAAVVVAPATTGVAAPQAQNAAAAGFTAASGGAWSKHAFDLLGIGRPGRAIQN